MNWNLYYCEKSNVINLTLCWTAVIKLTSNESAREHCHPSSALCHFDVVTSQIEWYPPSTTIIIPLTAGRGGFCFSPLNVVHFSDCIHCAYWTTGTVFTVLVWDEAFFRDMFSEFRDYAVFLNRFDHNSQLV